MKILKRIITLIITILIISTLTSTTQTNMFASASLNSNNKNVFNVAVLLYSFDDAFMQQIKQSLERIQEENIDKVRFTFYDGKNNMAIQNETLDSIIQGNTDLIIGNLADSKESSVEEVILKVKQKNIPLILLQIDPKVVSNVSKYYDKVAFVTTDAKQAGTIEGQIIADLWNNNKKVIDRNNDNILQYVLLKGEVDSNIAIDRSNYAISTINNSGIQIQELAQTNANWLKELAKNSIENLFLKYDGNIEAIISNNDDMAIGAIEALQEYGYNKGDKSKKIAVVGIDALPEAKDLVDKGLMTGTVIQDPRIYAQGLYTIGLNLLNEENPIKDTNYEISEGVIILPIAFEAYTSKANTP